MLLKQFWWIGKSVYLFFFFYLLSDNVTHKKIDQSGFDTATPFIHRYSFDKQ